MISSYQTLSVLPGPRQVLILHSQDALDDFTVHVGQAEAAPLITERQTLVIDAQQMEQRGVEIVHVHRRLRRRVAQLVAVVVLPVAAALILAAAPAGAADLTAASVEGQGSTFTLTLPRTPPLG